jgi:hypothetical protein
VSSHVELVCKAVVVLFFGGMDHSATIFFFAAVEKIYRGDRSPMGEDLLLSFVCLQWGFDFDVVSLFSLCSLIRTSSIV